MVPSKKQLQHEARLCGEAVRAPLSEFFDSWIIIGLRAGSDDALHVTRAESAAELRKLEAVMAQLTLEIARRKQCRHGRRKK